MEFKLDTPENLDSMSRQELLDATIETVPCLFNKEKRLQIIENLYREFGLQLSNDIRYALLTETERLLIIALAGAGKTTNTVMKVILEQYFNMNNEDLRAENFLFIVYNKDNVGDIERIYNDLCDKLYDIFGIKLDRNIRVKTMHSIAQTFLKDYSVRLGKSDMRLVTDDALKKLMIRSINNWSRRKKLPDNMTDAQKILYEKRMSAVSDKAVDILGVYDLQNETLYDYNQIEDTESFKELKISIEDYIDIIKEFKKQLKRRGLFTYSDSLVMFRNLLKDNEDVRKRMSNLFKFIIVDEVQDITKVMLDSLELMVGKDSRFIAIGDDDQSIYGFRGVSVENTLGFKERFKEYNPKVLSLNLNRRCPVNVVKLGKEILKLNEDRRYDKKMKAMNRYGDITIHKYTDQISEALMITNEIKKLVDKGEEDIVVSYRNNDSIDVIREIFIRENIPFHTGKNEEPFNFYLYRNTLKILEACYMPHIVQNQLNLYMVLPFSKADIHALLEYDEKTGIFNAPPHRITELPIDKIAKSVKTANAYKKFCVIAEKVKTEPMNTYMNELLDMLIANYYMPNKSVNHDFLVSMVRSYFNSELPFSQFYVEHSKKYSKMLLWQQTRRGVRLSTFHTLKGLGFNEVFLMDLDNDIFPNENRLEIQDLSEKEKIARADESNRLFYVAVTRTKKNLHMYFNKENPSRYIELMDERVIGRPTEELKKKEIRKEIVKEVVYEKEEYLDDKDLFGINENLPITEDSVTEEDLFGINSSSEEYSFGTDLSITDEDLFTSRELTSEDLFGATDSLITDNSSVTDGDLFIAEVKDDDLFVGQEPDELSLSKIKEEVINEQIMEEPIVTKKSWRSTKLKDRFRR